MTGSGQSSESGRFHAAIAAIDAVNADDPNTLSVGGVERPKELVHAELMTAWVQRLDPDATPAQLLAARAHHLRRWSLARASYPEGRAGYLRWRADLSKQHAAEVAGLLAEVGYDRATIERVQAIVRKQNLRTDAQVQTHEDALCLVFLQTQFGPLARRLGADKTVDVLAKSIRKMSPQGVAAAGALAFSPEEADLLAAAVRVVDQDREAQGAAVSEPSDAPPPPPPPPPAATSTPPPPPSTSGPPPPPPATSTPPPPPPATSTPPPPPPATSGPPPPPSWDATPPPPAPPEATPPPPAPPSWDQPPPAPPAEAPPPPPPPLPSDARSAASWDAPPPAPPAFSQEPEAGSLDPAWSGAPPPPPPPSAPAAPIADDPAPVVNESPPPPAAPAAPIADDPAPVVNESPPPPAAPAAPPATADVVVSPPPPVVEDPLPVEKPEVIPRADAVSATEADAHDLGVALGRLMGGSRRTAKAAALVAATRLADGERVQIALGGRFRGKDGAVVLTDRQLILANNREWDPEVVSLDTSTPFDVEHWVERRAATLRLSDESGTHVVDRINDLGVAEALIEALQRL